MASPPSSSFDETAFLTQVIRSCATIATYFRPELGAMLALWFCQRHREAAGIKPAQVRFLSVHTKTLKDGILGIGLAEDVGPKIMGSGWTIGRSSLGGSAAMAIFRTLDSEDRILFRTLAEAISDDEEGVNVHKKLLKDTRLWKNLPIRHQVLATSLWVAYEYVKEMLDDHALYEWFACYLNGMVKKRDEKALADHVAQQAQYLPSGLAILPHNAPAKTSHAALNRGAKLAFFSKEVGSNTWLLGVTKSFKTAIPESTMRELKESISSTLPDACITEDLRTVGWVGQNPLVCTKTEFEQKRNTLLNAVIRVLEKKSN